MADIQYSNFKLDKPEIKYLLDTYISILCTFNLKYEIEEITDNHVLVTFSTPNESKSISFKLTSSNIVESFLNKNLLLNRYQNNYTNSSVPYLGDAVSDIDFDNFDFFTIPFIELTRYEEYVNSNNDVHDRFRFQESLAYHYKYFNIAIVDEYLLILKDLLQVTLKSVSFEERFSKVVTTHDIDEIERFPSFKLSIRTIIGDLVLYKSFSLAVRSIIQCVRTFFKISRDPYLESIYILANESLKRGLESIFFFMASEPSKYDKGYKLEKLLSVFDYLKVNNCDIGLHPGYYTFNSRDNYEKQLLKLESAVGFKIEKNRQHFLRFDIKQTINNLISSGIKIDYTLGYAEQEGFRCGTSHRYKLFNVIERNEFDIEIQPLIAMDVTLTEYQKYSESEALDSLVDLKRKIDIYGGVFVILWHNAYVTRERRRFNEIYINFLNTVEK